MGCFNSKSVADRQNADPTTVHTKKVNKAVPAEKAKNGKDDSANPQHSAEQFLRSLLDGAEHFFNNLPDSQGVKQVVALTFLNSCVEVTRSKFRVKLDVIIDLASSLTQQLKLSLFHSALPHVEERSVDDSFSRILLAWFSNNSMFAKKIPEETGQIILDTLYIRYVVTKPVTFEDILVFQFRWVSVNQAAMEVFSKFAEGKESMTAEQLGRFLRETQRIEVSDRQLTEKLKYRFGGAIHRYNFASYNGSILTNNAIEPSRTSDVWQDMTQSFTHYLVSCARIETGNDLQRAMTDGIRALVLNLKRGDDNEIYSGTCSLKAITETVKKCGFVTNTYPIVLCLSPNNQMPVDMQDEVAKIISEFLGPMLAKGLMFEGAVIGDPKFSPGALRKKVLLMGNQRPLRAFIGFMVADMNKDGLGVRVTDVVEGTPAAKGGIAKDDWLTHVNGDAIMNKKHLRESLSKLKVGDEFTVKRENLDEIKIVVGGVVDPQSSVTTSALLSELVFFKYAAGKNPKPWDTERLTQTALAGSPKERNQYTDHFAFVSIDPEEEKAPDYEGNAYRMGVQFVDIDNSCRCLAWSLGRFYDNGRCGYFLKTEMEAEKCPDLTLNLIGGPRIIGAPPLSSVTVQIHGNGVARVQGSQITFTGCDEATLAVLHATFEGTSVGCYIAPFSPALIRSGYRALPSITTGDEQAPRRPIHGIYLFAKRH